MNDGNEFFCVLFTELGVASLTWSMKLTTRDARKTAVTYALTIKFVNHAAISSGNTPWLNDRLTARTAVLRNKSIPTAMDS